MAFAAPLIAGASALLGAFTAIQQGNYQAAVARNNAQIAEENAARLSTAAQQEAQRSDQDYRALMGEQLAAQGASGFDILGRSQLRARRLTQRTGRMAAMDIRTEGEAGSRRLLQDAANSRAEGRQARTQGYLSAGASLLQGASTMIGPSRSGGRRRFR